MEPRGSAALVTGGGRGLGAALGRALARAGSRVVLVSRTSAEVEEVAASLRAEGWEAHALAADVGEPDAAARIAGAAAQLVGPIDVLVHAASTLGPLPLRPLLDTTAEELERVLAVNLVGPFRLSRAVAGAMALRGRGLLLHITSDAGTTACRGWGPYGVSKAALDHLARIWAVELAESGVRALTVDPGEMDTRMHAEAMPDADRAALARPEDVAQRIAALIERAEDVPSGARLELAALPARPTGWEVRP